MSPRPRPSGDHELAVRAARLHFEFGLTHEETAEQLGLSRIKVTRLLKQAREDGIVQITVIGGVGVYGDVEDRLRQATTLREVIVVPSAPSAEELRRRLALAVAHYLQRVLRDGMVVAVGMSRTIALVAPNLAGTPSVHARFVSSSGAPPDKGGSPFESTQALATAMGSEAVHVHAPVVVSSARTAVQLKRDRSIAGALEQAADADLALVGVGGARDRLVLVGGDYYTETELENVRQLGAVGDIGGRFFDRNGMAVHSPVDERMIGLTLDQFVKIPNCVVAAGGEDKVEAIAAVLRGDLASVLVTDLDTARMVMTDLHRQG